MIQIDRDYMLNCFETIVKTPSPTGYYPKVNAVVEEIVNKLGHKVTYDRKHTAYITLEGEDNSKTVMLGAHLDTIGLVVRSIQSDGTLLVRELGGVSHSSAEDETVTIHTRSGKTYTGLYVCKSHSVHMFDDAKTRVRDVDSMMILLDEPVKNKEDVVALGIRNGDPVSIDPHFSVTPNGYIKSRFIDDKAAVAAIITTVKYLVDNNLKPKYRTICAFPHYEEIGHGGSYIPDEVEEFLAVDIGLVGENQDGSEYKVSICAKDGATPYDWDMTNKLIALAEKNECDYAVDVFYRYGTDGAAALRAGHDVAVGVCGMAVYGSHGVERTHIVGLEHTAKLLVSYVLDLK
ncbi:MAG: peptidase M42 [Epulopiscium sp. Nele67-Bin004]|nr:MAG: peptidase M42 [Epulopiscium sp. Nele67-Bin004]